MACGAGATKYVGKIASLPLCAAECRGVSVVFDYGSCTSGGCACYCELDGTERGCKDKEKYFNNYDLYMFIENSNKPGMWIPFATVG